MKRLFYTAVALSLLPAAAWGSVTVSSPANGQTLPSSVHYTGAATTTTCPKGVASMGVYVDDKLTYVVNATKLDTELALEAGKHNTVVQEWDYCGGSDFVPLSITVTG